MVSSRREFLQGVAAAGASALSGDSVTAVRNYIFGDNREGFFVLDDDTDDLDRVFDAFDKMDDRLRNPGAIDNISEIVGDGQIYVLGNLDTPLGIAYVNAFGSPKEFLAEGHLARPVARYPAFSGRTFDGYTGGDVIEVVPTVFYNRGLDAFAGDSRVVDLSKPSQRVFEGMVKQSKGLDGEYTFVRSSSMDDSFDLMRKHPFSGAVVNDEAMTLIYNRNDKSASYDAIAF